MRALVTGATGFVGRRLLARLEKPVVLSRDAAKAERALAKFQVKAYSWDPQTEKPPAAAFDGIDAIFHLAGDPIAEGRWTPAKKVRLRESRVAGTRHLVEALAGLTTKPRVLVSASAIGYYGSRGDEVLPESAPAGNDFLAEICAAWERESHAARDLGIRVVNPRIGIVLGPGGGPLAKMLPPFHFGLGAPLGSGRQYMSWIHIDDLVELLLFAAQTDSLSGPLNATAPGAVTNREFTKALGRALHRPTFFPPVPAFMLKLMLGDFAEILLDSQRVTPQAAQQAGFHFQFPALDAALQNILK